MLSRTLSCLSDVWDHKIKNSTMQLRVRCMSHLIDIALKMMPPKQGCLILLCTCCPTPLPRLLRPRLWWWGLKHVKRNRGCTVWGMRRGAGPLRRLENLWSSVTALSYVFLDSKQTHIACCTCAVVFGRLLLTLVKWGQSFFFFFPWLIKVWRSKTVLMIIEALNGIFFFYHAIRGSWFHPNL